MSDTPRSELLSLVDTVVSLAKAKAEVAALKAEVADLRERLDTAWGDNATSDRINASLRAELAQRTAEVAKANAERDEARRNLCYLAGGFDLQRSRRAAEVRGWKCFDAKEVQP